MSPDLYVCHNCDEILVSQYIRHCLKCEKRICCECADFITDYQTEDPNVEQFKDGCPICIEIKRLNFLK